MMPTRPRQAGLECQEVNVVACRRQSREVCDDLRVRQRIIKRQVADIEQPGRAPRRRATARGRSSQGRT